MKDAGLIVDEFIEAENLHSVLYEIQEDPSLDLVLFEYNNEITEVESVSFLLVESGVKSGKQIPLIILTAPDTLEEARKKVVDGYLIKPYDKDDLVNIFGKYFQVKQAV